MPRPLRVEYCGALLHIMARGNRREPIFLDDEDRADFLRRVIRLKSRFEIEVHAFVLMPNHVHLVVRRRHRSVGSFMLALLSPFALAFNRRHGTVGHVFQSRYKGLVCEDETYLLRLIRYVHHNPLRAGLTRSTHFLWSSYAAYLDDNLWPWVDTAPVLALFGRDASEACEAFREFHEGEHAIVESGGEFGVTERVFLGDSDFVRLARRRAATSVPESVIGRRSLDEILREVLVSSGQRLNAIEIRGPSRRRTAGLVRAAFVFAAVEVHGHCYAELAGYLRRTPATLRMILSRYRRSREMAPIPSEPQQADNLRSYRDSGSRRLQS